MQAVSKEYKESMKELLRERSFMMVSFGLVNQEAQANANVVENEFTYFSSKNIFGKSDDNIIYATFEQDFTKVDGSMFFLPRPKEENSYYDTGLIGSPFVEENGYELIINLNIKATDIKGVTINFGEIYPVDFDIYTESGQIFEIRDNDTGDWNTQEVFENTTYIRFVFHRMSKRYARLRIYAIQMGFGLVYDNKDILDSSLETYISPISEDVSQIDFYVKLQNYNQYFNVDNPKSAINFLETGQEMQIFYGYQLPDSDNVEWVKGGKLLCSEWESDDYSATIKCQDMLRTMDEEYFKGQYRPEGITLYNHAVLVFQDAGIENFYIDPYLKKITTKNPMPRVTHREALQIIANAGRCVLSQSRDGIPQIKSSFIPEISVASNGEAEYSKIANIKSDAKKDEYAAYSHNYTRTDTHNYFLPRDVSEANLYTGYISEWQSKEDCTFETNPIVTITQESVCSYYGFRIDFGSALPGEFIARTYNDGEFVQELIIGEEQISNMTIIRESLSDFDVMEIEFTKTKEPFNRIIINYFTFGDLTDFTMERKDMTSSPKAIKQELIKKVDVACYSYNDSNVTDTIVSEEVDVEENQIVIYYTGEPVYNYSAKFDGASENVKIISSGAYYVEIEFKKSGTGVIEISANRYNIAQQTITKQLNNRGRTITWQNPLVGDVEVAKDLSEWLGDYYDAGIEYEYSTRGNPEIDANDIVYQENQYRPGLKVNIYRHTVNFSQALSGKVVARRSVDNTQ